MWTTARNSRKCFLFFAGSTRGIMNLLTLEQHEHLRLLRRHDHQVRLSHRTRAQRSVLLRDDTQDQKDHQYQEVIQ